MWSRCQGYKNRDILWVYKQHQAHEWPSKRRLFFSPPGSERLGGEKNGLCQNTHYASQASAYLQSGNFFFCISCIKIAVFYHKGNMEIWFRLEQKIMIQFLVFLCWLPLLAFYLQSIHLNSYDRSKSCQLEQPSSIKRGVLSRLIKINCFCHAGLDPASRSPKNLIPWIPAL